MSRRDSAIKREVLQDPVYNSQLITRFINVIMKDGKKSIAERIVYDALESIGEKSEDDPMKVFKRAIENVKPAVEVKSRRVGGSTYQVPIEVRPSRRTALAFRSADPERHAARRAHHEAAAGGGADGSSRESWRGHQEEGRYPPYGGSEQGLRSLSLVVRVFPRSRGLSYPTT